MAIDELTDQMKNVDLSVEFRFLYLTEIGIQDRYTQAGFFKEVEGVGGAVQLKADPSLADYFSLHAQNALKMTQEEDYIKLLVASIYKQGPKPTENKNKAAEWEAFVLKLNQRTL